MFRSKKKFYPFIHLVCLASFSFFIEASNCESVFFKQFEASAIEKKIKKNNPTKKKKVVKKKVVKKKNPAEKKKSQSRSKNFEELSSKSVKTHKIPEEAQVIHIPQIHYTKLNPLRSEEYHFYKENIARTQLFIAKLIIDNKDSIFISESAALDYFSTVDLNLGNSGDGPSINKEIIEKNVRSDFYKKDFEKLTKKEKELLYFYEASTLLFFLGHIESIHSYIPKNIGGLCTTLKMCIKVIKMGIIDKMNKKKNSSLEEIELEETKQDMRLNSIVMNDRESLLKAKVELLKKKYPNKKIFFIFGAAHDFSYLFEGESFHRVPDSVIIPEQYFPHL